MKLYLMLLSALFLFNSNRCNPFDNLSQHTYIVTITAPDKIKEIRIPLQCSGWCIRRGKVIENTTNDTTKIWDKFFPPGKTGTFLSMECYDFYKKTPWTTTYIPYKATKGKIVIEWSLKPD